MFSDLLIDGRKWNGEDESAIVVAARTSKHQFGYITGGGLRLPVVALRRAYTGPRVISCTRSPILVDARRVMRRMRL